MKGKEIIVKLVFIYRKDNIVLDYIHMTLDSMSEYIHIINQQDNFLKVYKHSINSVDFRNTMLTLDRHRRMCHDCIISGIKKINLLCRENNIPLFYDGDEADRVSVGDFAMDVVKDTFNNRKK